MVEFSPLGIVSGGSQRWLNLGPISFQPSEIVKITTLLLMADGLSRFEWKHIEVLKRLAFCLLMSLALCFLSLYTFTFRARLITYEYLGHSSFLLFFSLQLTPLFRIFYSSVSSNDSEQNTCNS